MSVQNVQTNQFGEVSINQQSTAQAQAEVNALPAKTGVAALTAIATADATDLASAITLVNDCKAKINAFIAAIKVQS